MTEKWKKGYVTTDGEIAPRGTILCNGTIIRAASGADFPGSGWVVVREAPEAKWRRVVVEVRGEGEHAELRLSDGGVFDDGTPVYPSVIAEHATPAPDREKVNELARTYRSASVFQAEALSVLLDYVCGKDGA